MNNIMIAQICADNRCNHGVILVPIISPYRESREKARQLLGPDFYEIYFSADLKTVMARDVKGLYAKAQKGEIPDMIGLSSESVYEPPLHPDLVINSASENETDSIERLETFIIERLKRKIFL